MRTYHTIADAIDYLVAHADRPQDLKHLAARFKMDTTTFQKAFTAYVGVSPKQFQRYLSLKTAQDFLLKGYPTLGAAYEAGLSGNWCLHAACVTIDAASPGEIKARGRGITITYGWGDTPLGHVLIGATPRGICWLAFELGGDRAAPETLLRNRFKSAKFVNDCNTLSGYFEKINDLLAGQQSTKIRLNLYGTNFQMKVWEALLKIPKGCAMSYSQIAEDVCSSKKFSHAVGSAVGANPVSVLIPCHRVIQQSGVVENYAWGSARKRVLLGVEGMKYN